MADLELLDVVATAVEIPECGLLRGQVGTVAEVLARGVFEVEFSDDDGRTYALQALKERRLMRLRYAPQRAA